MSCVEQEGKIRMHTMYTSGRVCFALALVGLTHLVGCAASDEPPPTGSEAVAQAESIDDQGLSGGAMYAATNDASQNGVIHYRRHPDGRLEYVETVFTGGRGTGSKLIPELTEDGPDPLFSQHSLALSADHSTVLVVNAGDDTVTSFRVGRLGTLSFASRVASGGRFPTSIAIRGNLAYIGNAGDPANNAPARVTGFHIGSHGDLERITSGDGTFADPGAQPAHVLFSPDGSRLVVADRLTTHIDVFPIQRDGSLGVATVNDSFGLNPFGMVFASNTTLLVTEVQGLVPGATSVSSYRLDGTRLIPITPSLGTGRTAACWLSITPDRRYAYASNTFTGDISIFSVAPSGELGLVEASAVPRAPAPGFEASGLVDSAISAGGHYLYQGYSALGVIGAFRIGTDGRLTPVERGDGGGLPMLGSEGLDGF